MRAQRATAEKPGSIAVSERALGRRRRNDAPASWTQDDEST
jgi:hypothetical protein